MRARLLPLGHCPTLLEWCDILHCVSIVVLLCYCAFNSLWLHVTPWLLLAGRTFTADYRRLVAVHSEGGGEFNHILGAFLARLLGLVSGSLELL